MISRQVFIQVLGPLQHGRRPIRSGVEVKVVVTEGVTLSLPATLQPLAIGAGHTQVLEFELGWRKWELPGVSFNWTFVIFAALRLLISVPDGLVHVLGVVLLGLFSSPFCF